MTCKNCVSSAAIRQTDVLAEKYKSEIDYNMAEQQISKFISKLVKEHPVWMGAALSWQLCPEKLLSTRYISIKMRKSIGYNDFLHTKLLGVLGDSFVKRSGSEYRKVYDDYKNRYQNRADWKNDKGEVSAMRCHRAAIRQAIKAFLRDLWVEWRTYEGYTIPESYAEAHLGMAPHGYNEADMRPVE